MNYDEEFFDRVATALGFEHAFNLALESVTRHIGGAGEIKTALAQAIRLRENYKNRWKELLRQEQDPHDEFEKRCLREIFPRQIGLEDAR